MSVRAGMSGGIWMAEIRYRTPIDPDVTVTFNEFAELGRIIEQCGIERHTDCDEIENITITLNRSTRSHSKRKGKRA
jgi:hypothetical protein